MKTLHLKGTTTGRFSSKNNITELARPGVLLKQNFRPTTGPKTSAWSRRPSNLGLRFSFVQCPMMANNTVPVKECIKCPSCGKINFDTILCRWVGAKKEEIGQ